MPAAQITNPYGAFGLRGTGTGVGWEGAVTVEVQTRSTDIAPESAGSTVGPFRTILPGMVVTPTFATSSFYPKGLAVAAASDPGQLPFGIAAERISAFWGATGSTGLNSDIRQGPNNQVGSVIVYGLAYAMFASTDNPGAGDKAVPAYVVVATTDQSLFSASCHFGLCALSTSMPSSTATGGGITPTTGQNGYMNPIGIAFTSMGGISVTAATSGPQLYPIYVKQGV